MSATRNLDLLNQSHNGLISVGVLRDCVWSALRMMNFALQLMHFVLKLMNFVLKLMNFAPQMTQELRRNRVSSRAVLSVEAACRYRAYRR